MQGLGLSDHKDKEVLNLYSALRLCRSKFSGSSRWSAHHAGCDNAIRIASRFPLLDLINVFHTFRHLAPDRVLLVEEAGIVENNKKLRVGRIRVLRTGHGADAANMRFRIELGLDVGVGRTAHACAIRAAGLCHEAIDDAVKDDTIIEFLANELLDMGDMAWRQIWPHLDHDTPFGSFEYQCVVCCAHARKSCVG
jgi:hypothetical protein